MNPVFWQYLLPQHVLSRAVGYAAKSRVPWIKQALIRTFIQKYQVDLSEAAISDIREFEHFNDFFTRALKPGVRPIDADEAVVVAPADGAICAHGRVRDGSLLQAKDHIYSVQALLGPLAAWQASFADGFFATIYLAPKDYHRVHSPLAGTLVESCYIPGHLFSVNTQTTAHVPGLFARNERWVAILQTSLGPMAVVMVGAMIVAGIDTPWPDAIPTDKTRPSVWKPSVQPIVQKGAELGRFYLGSTAIVLLPALSANWQASVVDGSRIKMGQGLLRVSR